MALCLSESCDSAQPVRACLFAIRAAPDAVSSRVCHAFMHAALLVRTWTAQERCQWLVEAGARDDLLTADGDCAARLLAAMVARGMLHEEASPSFLSRPHLFLSACGVLVRCLALLPARAPLASQLVQLCSESSRQPVLNLTWSVCCRVQPLLPFTHIECDDAAADFLSQTPMLTAPLVSVTVVSASTCWHEC